MSTRSKTLDPDPQFTVGGGDMVFPDRDFPDRPPQGPMPRRSSRAAISAVVVVALIAGAGALYYYKSRNASPVTAAAPPDVTVPSPAQSRPPIQYPIEKTPGAETTQPSPLPALDD